MNEAGRIRADRLRATESLYGPLRSDRPSDLRGRTTICPFCPGNEALTGPALTGRAPSGPGLTGTAQGGPVLTGPAEGGPVLTGPALDASVTEAWRTRVVMNRYPALCEPDGRHEVIVETPLHDARWTTFDRTTIERIVNVYRDREAAGYADGHAFVAIFKKLRGAGGRIAPPFARPSPRLSRASAGSRRSARAPDAAVLHL